MTTTPWPTKIMMPNNSISTPLEQHVGDDVMMMMGTTSGSRNFDDEEEKDRGRTMRRRRISCFSSSLQFSSCLLLTSLLLLNVEGVQGAFLPPSSCSGPTNILVSRYPHHHQQQQQHSTISTKERWHPTHATFSIFNNNDNDDPDNGGVLSSSSSPITAKNEEKTSTMVTVKKQDDEATTTAALPTTSTSVVEDNNLDALHARAGVLRRSILQQQIELQQLERKIMCCYNSAEPSSGGNLLVEDDVRGFIALAWTRATQTFTNSGGVLWRKLQRVRGNVGVNNERWNGSVGQFMAAQSQSGVRIVEGVLKNQTQLLQLMDPNTPTLIAHVPAIVARLDKLESHMATILERVLNNQRHLASIEPYLDEILERFDDIEPHLPWILDHIDTLAPYTGLLLKHIDELLPYASLDDDETLPYGSTTKSNKDNSTTTPATTNYQYALAEQLLPYLEFYVSRLDTVGPHLPLLRPHVPKLLKHNRIAKMSPHIDKLFALGYAENLGASANMDVLLFWFGWALRVPGLPRLFFAIPGSPRLVTFLANRLPKRFVRGYCSGISCTVDEYQYGNQWNKLSK